MLDKQATFIWIDLNNDEKKEKISCKYWDRWGTFRNCLIKQDDTDLQIGQKKWMEYVGYWPWWKVFFRSSIKKF